MSVADSITGALKRFGRPMTLRRLTLTPGGVQTRLDVTVNVTTKGASASELIANQTQADTIITFSNAEIALAQWPGPPKKDDRIIDGATTKEVLAVETKYLGGEVLVHVCATKG